MSLLFIVPAILICTTYIVLDKPPVPTRTENEAHPGGITCTPPRPVQPASLLRDNTFTEASATIKITILPSGKIESAVVIESTGHKAWDQASIKAMQRIRCSPNKVATGKIQVKRKLTLTADR